MSEQKAGRVLSVRMTSALERRIKARSKAEKKTESEVVRELLERGLESSELSDLTTIGQRAGHLFGSISDDLLPNGKDVEKHLVKHWKPNRRG